MIRRLLAIKRKLMTYRVFAWTWQVVARWFNSNCSIHAAGLSYFVLISVVPLLCILLFTAKICGADEMARREVNRHLDGMISNIEKGHDEKFVQLLSETNDVTEEDQLRKHGAALEFGSQARRISDVVFDRIDRFDFETLGFIGIGLLLWTIISSLATIESSFNEIFEVRSGRAVLKRALLYVLITVLLPILIILIMSVPVLHILKLIVTKTFGSAIYLRWLSDSLLCVLNSAAWRMTFVLTMTSLTFALLFWLVPHCKVRKRHALFGGFLTALMMAGWLKICAYAQIGIARSSMLYGSFSFFPIVLAWSYVSWQIILIGAIMVRSFETTKVRVPRSAAKQALV